MTKEEFLLDTLDYYSEDISRRCSSNSGCKYSPKNAGKEGKSDGCSIGRWMTPENQQLADEQANSAYDDILQRTPWLLPNFIKNFPVRFVIEVQTLHDITIYWNIIGLSSSGKLRTSSIITEFSLNPAGFEKYLPDNFLLSEKN